MELFDNLKIRKKGETKKKQRGKMCENLILKETAVVCRVRVVVSLVCRRVRCAERTGSGLLLWQHEFFMVVERDPYRRPLKPYLYQALEFRIGSQMPPEEIKGLKKKQLEEIKAGGKKRVRFVKDHAR